jgi:3-oxoacyl-[acyl-carrier-protein] synthase-3
LIESSDQQSLSRFQFGTDGSGADTLLVTQGGARRAEDAHKPRHRQRWRSELYMDGPSLISFTVAAVPQLVQEIVDGAGLREDEIDLFLFHQATHKMLAMLQERLGLDDRRLPIVLREYGNTVSSTIPITIREMRNQQRLSAERKNLIVGFGVGWSWGGCIWQDLRPLANS